MLFSYFELIYFAGAASAVGVALFLSWVLNSYTKPKHGYLQWILPVLALCILSNIAMALLQISGVLERDINEPFQLLIGPVLFFYLQFLINQEVSSKSKLLHLIPFMITTIIFVGTLINAFSSEELSGDNHFILWLLSIMVYGQLWFYFFFCRSALKRYQTQLMQTCSGIEKLSESWIGNALIAILVAHTALSIVYLLNHGPASIPVNQTLAGIFALLTYYICYSTLRFSFAFATEPPALEPARYEKSGLDEHTAQQVSEKLHKLMIEEEPYLDPDLKIATLAEQLGVGMHHLSQVINTAKGEQEGQNFYDFVNGFRVQAVLKKFKDPAFKDETILSIAFDSGFTSKATFNRVFKKHTEQTPLEYRKTINLKK